MISLNVSFGIYAFLPQGWLFMAIVVFLECMILSYWLSHHWFNGKVCKTVILSNIISGIAGIYGSMLLNGGWYLVVWFPWVSSHEIDLTNPGSRQFLIIYYLVAFVLSVLIETSINLLSLKEKYTIKKIVQGTFIANLITYAVGTLVLYLYSFSIE